MVFLGEALEVQASLAGQQTHQGHFSAGNLSIRGVSCLVSRCPSWLASPLGLRCSSSGSLSLSGSNWHPSPPFIAQLPEYPQVAVPLPAVSRRRSRGSKEAHVLKPSARVSPKFCTLFMWMDAPFEVSYGVEGQRGDLTVNYRWKMWNRQTQE